MPTVFLGLGSNLGDRQGNIRLAIQKLVEHRIRPCKVSSIIETDPIGGVPQGRFLNAVLEAETDHPPEDLLTHLKTIEHDLGRRVTIRNGPRPIDLDILIYDDLRMATPELTIPHPRIAEREFVLKPLREIAPEMAEKFRP